MVKDKVAVVTGSASGIGLAMAHAFAKEGAKVVLSDINEEALAHAVAEIHAEGGKAMGLRCDVAEESEIQELVEDTMDEYGAVDIFISNAGMQHVAKIEDFDTQIYERMLKLMLVAPFVAIKEVLPLMRKKGWGRIINIASINGLVGFAGKAGYNSAKHGLLGLTKVAALEAAKDGVTINALCPGYVDTPLVRNQFQDLARTRGISEQEVLEKVLYPLVPQQKLLTTDEIAAYALFICSDQAASITGQALIMDGGYTVQ